MAGKSSELLRAPAVAGRFYPSDEREMKRQVAELFSSIEPEKSGSRWFGGIVPHAGWICSAAVAAQTLSAIARSTPAPDVIVVFASIHTPIETTVAVVDDYDAWQIPGARMRPHDGLRRELLKSECFACDERFHESDHAVEVELPLLAYAFGNVPFVAIETPTIASAGRFGIEVAQAIRRLGLNAVVLASSDLTHYGPAYDFEPAGGGERGELWARENDRELLDAVVSLDAGRVVRHSLERFSACGGGAIAAMVDCCRSLGATRATVLRHMNSRQTLRAVQPDASDNFVGYGSVVIGTAVE